MLSIRNVSAAYDRAEVLSDVSLSLQKAKVTALIGANGAGKSSLLLAIMGAMPRVKGHIDIDGVEICGLSSSEIVKRGVSLVPEGRRIFSSLTVMENLKVGAYVAPSRQGMGERIAEIFELFPRLAERREFLGSSLSGGEQQMLAIGRAMMARPQWLLLDEPSMGLAPLVVDQVFAVLRGLVAKGISILIVEQNAHRALEIADAAYVLETGRVVLEGSGMELLQDPRVREAYLGA